MVLPRRVYIEKRLKLLFDPQQLDCINVISYVLRLLTHTLLYVCMYMNNHRSSAVRALGR